MSEQQDAATIRATLVVLRTVTAVLAVGALLGGLVMSGTNSTVAYTAIGIGVVLGAVAVVLAAATGLLKQLSIGSAVVIIIGVVLLGLVLIDLTS